MKSSMQGALNGSSTYGQSAAALKKARKLCNQLFTTSYCKLKFTGDWMTYMIQET